MKNLFNNMDSSEIVRILEMHKKQGYSTINEQKNQFGFDITQFNRTSNKSTDDGISNDFKKARNIAKSKGKLAFKFNGKIHSVETGLVIPNPFKTPEELENFQKYVIRIINDPSIGRADSLWGVKSATAAIKYGVKYMDYLNKQKSKPKSKDRCIAITDKECAKIDSTKQSTINSGRDSETRCSAYMIKCLGQYDKELNGDAWTVFNNARKRGTIKYNAYTDGSVNWGYIYSELKKNKIGKTICNKYTAAEHSDEGKFSPLPRIISDSMPKSSKIDIDSLKLGDIVGMYHSKSTSKGFAFCKRAIIKKLDDNGNMNNEPFTFNSHVGFVGAIKDGMPIIIHNVGGYHTATPADQMLSVTSEDMIVWVVSDNQVASAIESQKNNTTV